EESSLMELTVGTARGVKGKCVRGVIEVVRGINSVEIPVAVITGSASGPVVGVIAGEHACEYAGVEAVGRLYHHLEPRMVSGAVVLVPVVNVPAFRTATSRVNPLDGLNISQVYPGDPTFAPPDIHAKWIGLAAGDTVSHRIARLMLNEVAYKCNYLINLHGGDLGEELFPYVIVSESEDAKVNAKSMEIALAFGTEHVQVSPSQRGFIGQAMLRGIPGFVTEIGYNGRYDEEHIQMQSRGVENVLKHVGVLPGARQPLEGFDSNKIRRGNKAVVVTSSASGLYRPHVTVRQTFREGDALAEITDEWGEVVESIRAQHDGLLRILYLKRIVNPGDALFKYDVEN
ncbi:MAG TPA: succinylglutamate desuccinylase/aspartoacylase family protein, partial [Anaerolineales bacterium]